MSILYRKHEAYPDSILIRNFIEKINVSDIIDSWEYLIENKMITGTLKGVINNLQDCELQMDINSFKTLIAYLKRNDCLSKIKLAVICDNPKTIVFPMLGEKEEHELKIRPFSTLEAAVHWIIYEL
jgi:hypothetical protein